MDCTPKQQLDGSYQCSMCGKLWPKHAPLVAKRQCTAEPTAPISKDGQHVTGTVELGDLVEQALSAVGITKDRVSRWLGRPCGCARRQEKLNQISRWAKRILSGKTEGAQQHLENILEE